MSASRQTRSDGPPRTADPDEGVQPRSRVERILDAYLGDTAMWPIVFAVAGHLLVVLAPLMLGLVRSRSPIGFFGLVGFAIPTVGLVRAGFRIKRPVTTLFVVVFMWGGAVGLAWAADHWQFY